jgi:hypothetical protein
MAGLIIMAGTGMIIMAGMIITRKRRKGKAFFCHVCIIIAASIMILDMIKNLGLFTIVMQLVEADSIFFRYQAEQ